MRNLLPLNILEIDFSKMKIPKIIIFLYIYVFFSFNSKSKKIKVKIVVIIWLKVALTLNKLNYTKLLT